MHQDILFLVFDYLEEAKRVLETKGRWFSGGSLKLEWWNLDFGCVSNEEAMGRHG